MLLRQRVLSYGISATALATVVGAALLHGRTASTLAPTTPGPAADPVAVAAEPPAGPQQNVDLVFVVDTTQSMGKLLDAAKQTVWSIATHIQSSDQHVNLRIGLVAFRDMTDVYVTRPFALTSDLDAVSAELFQYRPEGGGDLPENVAAGMNDALHMHWRADAKKIVFVVGDADAANRGDVPTVDVLARELAAQHIVVNTIRCGNDDDTRTTFMQIAALGGGDYASINPGSVQQIATPYDDRMAAARTRIDSSVRIVGEEGKRDAYAAKMEAVAAAPMATRADRATYYTKGAPGTPARRPADDLVTGVAGGTMSLDSIAQGDLPADLRGKDAATVKAEVAKLAADRDAAEAELVGLAKQRDEYLAKQARMGADGFDANVTSTVDKQLAK